MRKQLTQNILPFWLENAIDSEYGGIFTCLDKEGNIYGEEKSVWFQGRALYIFSTAYNLIEKNEKYLEAARKIYEFLPLCGDENGRLCFTVTRDGKEIQKRRYFFSETFAAIGCAEYYLATGNEEAKEKALMYFDVAYNLFTGKIYSEPKFNPDTYEYRSLSPAMIMLSTCQIMRKLNKEKYDKIAKEAIKKILIHLTDKGLLENVSPDGKFVNTPTGRIVNPGHSLEAAWFLMAEGLYQNDESLKNAGKQIIDITLPLGLDKKYGGIIAFTDADNKPPVQLEWDMKLWWPQCEAMIALRLAYLIFGEEKYKNTYKELKEYCEKYFYDNENDEWYGYLHYDNTVSTTLKGNIFKGPFHIPRFYILMDIMDRTGNIIDFIK